MTFAKNYNKKKTLPILTLLPLLIATLFFSNGAYAFQDGIVLTLRADFEVSLTTPEISKEELALLGGANKMDGMAGFVMAGEAELGYIFNAKEWMNIDNKYFTGIGLHFNLGVGQGHSGQISGMNEAGKQIDVFVNVYYTPVITFATSLRVYLFEGRMALGTSIGGKMIADPAPTFQMYNNAGLKELQGVGSMIITEWQMKNMNPFAFRNKFFIEYNQPIVEKMELGLGLFFAYNIYQPKYLTLPPDLLEGAKGKGFDPKRKLNSFYLNSTEFGLSIGLNFKAL